jgi:hypothetical protein
MASEKMQKKIFRQKIGKEREGTLFITKASKFRYLFNTVKTALGANVYKNDFTYPKIKNAT